VQLEDLTTVVASNEENGGEIFELHDVLSDGQEDPGTTALRRLDWDSFMEALDEREKAVIEYMVAGRCGSAIVRKLRVCDSTIQTIKRHLAKALVDFMGPEILKEIQRRPGWKDNLEASKERMACRYDRCHL